MKKSDKKIENTLRETLTQVCDMTLGELEGFSWLTHRVNYSHFPKSLRVTCVFDTSLELENAIAKGQDTSLSELIRSKLESAGIVLKNINTHVFFDSQQACNEEHAGKWDERLAL